MRTVRARHCRYARAVERGNRTMIASAAAGASQVINEAGAKQPGSVGFGPHSGSQNRDLRQLRSRASHLVRSSGISPKLTS